MRAYRRRSSSASESRAATSGSRSDRTASGWHEPAFLLRSEHLLPVRVPAVVEHPVVAVGPLLGDVVRRVHRPGAEVQEERLGRRGLLGVADERDRVVDEVLGEVVAVLRARWRFDVLVVGDEVRMVLVGVAAEEPVVAVEPAAQRPPVVGAGRRDLLGWRQVPLAHGVGVVAAGAQDLRQEAVLERDVAVVARVAGRDLGDPRHRVRVVVAPRQQA
jgi:hypothetical protein